MKHYIDEKKSYAKNIKKAYGRVFNKKEIEAIAEEVEYLIGGMGVHPDDAINEAIANLGFEDRLVKKHQ